VELETEVFGQREELNKQEEARQQLEAMLEQQGVEMQEEASEEEEGEEEKEAQPQPPMLSADVVNTKAYLLWIENGRPDGADFGHAAYTWLVEAFHDGSSVEELEATVFGQKAAQDEKAAEEERRRVEEEEEMERVRKAAAEAAEAEAAAKAAAAAAEREQKAEEVAAAAAAEAERQAREAAEEAAREKEAAPKPPELSTQLVNTKAYLLWIDAGRPEGADFGHEAYTWLVDACNTGRSVGALELEVFEQKGNQDERDRLEAERRRAEEEAERAELSKLSPDVVNAKAYLLWIENGRPNGADFGHAAYTWLVEAFRCGRAVGELQEEVMSQKAAQDEQERLEEEKRRQEEEAERAAAEAERTAAAQDLASHVVEVESSDDEDAAPAVPQLSSKLINVKAYLLWIDAGRPDGADFGHDAYTCLMEAVHGGRSLADLEEEVFVEKAKQDKADKEAKARFVDVDIGPAFTHWRRRNALDLIKSTSKKAVGASAPSTFDALLEQVAHDTSVLHASLFPIHGQGRMLAVAKEGAVQFFTDSEEPLVLHWGVAMDMERTEWLKPGAELVAAGSTLTDGIAAETPFEALDGDEGMQQLRIELPRGCGVMGIPAVLRSEDSSHWWKDGNKNYVMWIPQEGEDLQAAKDAASPFAEQFAHDMIGRVIAESENEVMWTLMHRYNKAADLLEEMMAGQHRRTVEDAHIAASLFVWLRYSANRHITWQRNYNTQPRILSAAQDRLTRAISAAYASTTGEAQEWVRSMIGLLGRGGDGQRIRDEILNIMHRNGIKEVKGSWVEEWHQKLHNNTTPDDIGICEAYLAFLQEGGNNAAYWAVLDQHGISRERLQGFDRPINAEPEDFPWMRDNLIGEFQNYLGILKAVHSGTDLHTCAGAADWCTPGEAKGHLHHVLGNLHGQALPLIEAAVEARAEIAPALHDGNRELLYLDLALENTVRMAAERVAGAPPQASMQLVGPLLQNLALAAGDNEELCYCLADWNALPEHLRAGAYPAKDEALRVAAVLDRIRNVLGVISDSITKRTEPISRELGKAFGVPEWAVKLFAEEVVRGSAMFAVSQVLTRVEEMLRVAAELGAWQVISPGHAVGRVVVAKELYPIQDKIYEESTVLIVDAVSGEEEIPQGVAAVLTRSAPDVLSHVSVRARNMGCLLASCYDDETFNTLRNTCAPVMMVETLPSGDMHFEAAEEAALHSMDEGQPSGGFLGFLRAGGAPRLQLHTPSWCGQYAVGIGGFQDGVVGAKSKGIAELRGKLPEWVSVPEAVTVPFGSFERSLEERIAKQLRNDIEASVKKAMKAGGQEVEALAHCREMVQSMPVPEQLQVELMAEMERAGMSWPGGPEQVALGMEALKGVWASKFNDRAYYSLRKAGLAFDHVRMAVLVMHVVPAEYAFVIHTTNPITRDCGEIYCELVRGLGETLVSGQFPGRGMAFSARKDALDQPAVLSYPSKSEAMFVRDSLIFRSDSNAEDLDGYAGAGLYDSITMHECETRRVNYAEDKIVTDDAFRNEILSKICQVGFSIEEALGGAQDIEGVVDEAGHITIVQARPQV